MFATELLRNGQVWLGVCGGVIRWHTSRAQISNRKCLQAHDSPLSKLRFFKTSASAIMDDDDDDGRRASFASSWRSLPKENRCNCLLPSHVLALQSALSTRRRAPTFSSNAQFNPGSKNLKMETRVQFRLALLQSGSAETHRSSCRIRAHRDACEIAFARVRVFACVCVNEEGVKWPRIYKTHC